MHVEPQTVEEVQCWFKWVSERDSQGFKSVFRSGFRRIFRGGFRGAFKGGFGGRLEKCIHREVWRIWWVSEEQRERSKRKKAVQLGVCCMWRTVRLAGSEQSTHDSSKQQVGEHLSLPKARSAHGSVRQPCRRKRASSMFSTMAKRAGRGRWWWRL